MLDDPYTSVQKFIMSYDERWCNALGFFNPYLDPCEYHLTHEVPVHDGPAYERYPEHNFVYDKLWIAQSQDIPCGMVVELLTDKDDIENLSFPIFIKPRWGHKNSGSKYCKKINNVRELPNQKEADRKDLIWSDFIDGREGMTDFILVSGHVVYQMTHQYSSEQHSFADIWKYTSSENRPPRSVASWVDAHLSGFTGIVNVQYRDGLIIEVGLRPARTGAYFAATDNEALLRNISSVLADSDWNFEDTHKMHYKPYYSFKCHTDAPIVYMWPQYVLDVLVRTITNRPFYEYYFEPTGKRGMVFLQFMHDDLEEGKEATSYLEKLFTLTQWGMIGLISAVGIALVLDVPGKWWIAAGVGILYLSQYLNPLNVPIRIQRAKHIQSIT